MRLFKRHRCPPVVLMPIDEEELRRIRRDAVIDYLRQQSNDGLVTIPADELKALRGELAWVEGYCREADDETASVLQAHFEYARSDGVLPQDVSPPAWLTGGRRLMGDYGAWKAQQLEVARETIAVQKRLLELAMRKTEHLAQALYEIREQDPIEMALDPQRAQRVAAEALRTEPAWLTGDPT